MFEKAKEILAKYQAVTDGIPDPFLEAELTGDKEVRMTLINELREVGYTALVDTDMSSVIISKPRG